MLKQITRVVVVLLLALLGPILMSVVVDAQYSSSNYKVDETFIGGGGELNACSSSYCSKQAAGETAVGATNSTNFGAQAGFNTSDQEVLEVVVSGGLVDLGTLSPTSTKSGSVTFSIRNYLSDGYVVRIDGKPPANPSGGHVLDGMPVQQAPTTGVEEFGINLRQNTSPAIGADPQQIPDSTFSFGTYTTGYGIADEFRFIEGDIIAESTRSTGKTLYTITMIADISTGTPGGDYYGYLYVNAIPTF